MQAILFDYYGVIGRDPLATWRKMHNLDDKQWQMVQNICGLSDEGAIDLPEFYRQLGMLVNLSGPQTQGELDAAVGTDQAMVKLLHDLKKRNLKVVLLSNSGPTLRNNLTQFNLTELFDQIIISSEVGAVKPEPRMFEIALERLSVAPDQALFFDDRQQNVDGALAAGLAADLFIDDQQCRAVLQRYGCLDR